MNGGNGIALRATQVENLYTGSPSVVTIQPTSQLEVQEREGGGSDDVSNSSGATQAAESSSGYTAGQMAGVGVGVGVPLLLALLAALFVIMRQRKRLQRSSSAVPVDEKRSYAATPVQSPGYSSYPPSSKPSERYPSYTRPGNFGQPDSIAQVNEMDNAAQRQELPAGR